MLYFVCHELFYREIITITFEPFDEFYWYFYSEIRHVFYDRNRFVYSEVYDDEVLESELDIGVENNDISPVSHGDSYKVDHHFEES